MRSVLCIGILLGASAAWAQTSLEPSAALPIPPSTGAMPGSATQPSGATQPPIAAPPVAPPMPLGYQSLSSPGTSLPPPPTTTSPSPSSEPSSLSTPPPVAAPPLNTIGGATPSPNNPNPTIGGVPTSQ